MFQRQFCDKLFFLLPVFHQVTFLMVFVRHALTIGSCKSSFRLLLNWLHRWGSSNIFCKKPKPLPTKYTRNDKPLWDLQLLCIKQMLLKSLIPHYPWALIDTINVLAAESTNQIFFSPWGIPVAGWHSITFALLHRKKERNTLSRILAENARDKSRYLYSEVLSATGMTPHIILTLGELLQFH